MTDLAPYDREVNTVFQDYALFPHMTVGGNVEYGLRGGEGRRGERERRRAEALEMVRLSGYDERKPAELSGGQRQRVALARAIVNRPRVLLLDEPLGALDLKLREQMQIELKQIQREVGITFVYVTHDQEEALTMSDRIAVFNEGRIEQVGRPEDVYEQPGNAFVAGFVGISNLLERDGKASRCGRRRSAARARARAPRDAGRGRARIADVSYAGMVTRFLVDLDEGGELQVVRQNLETTSAEDQEQRGRKVKVGWRREHTVAVPGSERNEEEERGCRSDNPRDGPGSSSSASCAFMLAFARLRRRRRRRQRRRPRCRPRSARARARST